MTFDPARTSGAGLFVAIRLWNMHVSHDSRDATVSAWHKHVASSLQPVSVAVVLEQVVAHWHQQFDYFSSSSGLGTHRCFHRTIGNVHELRCSKSLVADCDTERENCEAIS